jgi:hypothetical protein
MRDGERERGNERASLLLSLTLSLIPFIYLVSDVNCAGESLSEIHARTVCVSRSGSYKLQLWIAPETT